MKVTVQKREEENGRQVRFLEGLKKPEILWPLIRSQFQMSTEWVPTSLGPRYRSALMAPDGDLRLQKDDMVYRTLQSSIRL